MFRQWAHWWDTKYKDYALWLTKNEIVFYEYNPNTFLQVLFREMGWPQEVDHPNMLHIKIGGNMVFCFPLRFFYWLRDEAITSFYYNKLLVYFFL